MNTETDVDAKTDKRLPRLYMPHRIMLPILLYAKLCTSYAISGKCEVSTNIMYRIKYLLKLFMNVLNTRSYNQKP